MAINKKEFNLVIETLGLEYYIEELQTLLEDTIDKQGRTKIIEMFTQAQFFDSVEQRIDDDRCEITDRVTKLIKEYYTEQT